MAEAVITVILTQAGAILEQMVHREIRLVSGAGEDFKKLCSTFKSIQAVLVDAEKRRVTEESVKIWLEKLKDVAYDAEDVLSEWLTSMQMMSNKDKETQEPIYKKVFTVPFTGLKKVALRRDIALKIEEINETLDHIATEKERYSFRVLERREGLDDRIQTPSYVDLSEVEGRDEEKDELVNQILHQKNPLSVFSIVGLGGIGKTTLAQLVYNSEALRDHFSDLRMWVCVSEPFDDVRVAKAMVEDAQGTAPYAFELQTVLRHLRNNVQGKRYLLVLDDVWVKDYRKWEQIFNSLKTGATGSTVLVTTRSNEVARTMGSSYELVLGKLQDQDSWSLFSRIAFWETSDEQRKVLEPIGKEIAKRCQGLPLAVKTIASLMRFKPSLQEWQEVFLSEFWKLKEVKENFFPPLMLSYYELPLPMKRCFSFCAFFPKDHVIEADTLIKLWMAQGYLSSTENGESMESTGEKYLQNLAMRSFFQDLVKHKDGNKILRFKIHDLVHDFAMYLNQKEFYSVDASSDMVPKMGLNWEPLIRHVTMVRSEDLRFPTNIQNVEKLHSFWVQCFSDCPKILSELDEIDPNLLSCMARIKALDLSRNRLGALPKVGKAMSLKYLNLSHNPLRDLPETICEFFNLQSLNLTGCDHLRKLPRGIGKLVNLRHLEIDGTSSLKSLPKGVASLVSLQTLSKFVVGQGVEGDEATCKIQDLNNLKNLRGRLVIQGISYSTNVDEAKRSEMRRKKLLEDVVLDFGVKTQPNGREDEVIEALQLHENTKTLQIASFGGTKLPEWLMNLRSLAELHLKDCCNCASLPPLGRLPALVMLYIEGMGGVRCIGPEFLERSAFPKLKKLKIWNMEGLQEWNGGGKGDENGKIMPYLKCLKLAGCSKLNMLPEGLLHHATELSKLSIKQCPLLHQYYTTGNNMSKLSHIAKVRI